MKPSDFPKHIHILCHLMRITAFLMMLGSTLISLLVIIDLLTYTGWGYTISALFFSLIFLGTSSAMFIAISKFLKK